MIRRTGALGAILFASLLALALVLAATIATSSTVAGGLTADFGDAPDATNSVGPIMHAYPGVVARFPTALEAASSPYGPRHNNAPAFFILGAAYSAEEAADSGLDDDFDGINNLTPSVNVADNDGFDDGLLVPQTFEHCQPVTLVYSVTVLSTYAGPMLANVWADWNHNGAWGGGPPATCPGAGPTAAEWLLQNEPLNLTTPGSYTFSVTFTPWYPDPHAGTWLRLSVGEQAAGSDGSGPMAGYQYGETEDYRVPGTPYTALLPVVYSTGPNPPPPPSDPDTIVDPDEPPAVIASWPQLPPAADGTASIPEDGLLLRLENSGDFAGEATIDLTVIFNGAKSFQTIGPVPIQSGPYFTDVIVYPAPGISVRSPGTIQAEVHVTPDDPGQGGDPPPGQPFDTAAEPLYFHESTVQPGQLIIYNDLGYRAQILAQAFDDHPDLWSRLTAGFPGPIDPGLAQVVSYVHGDPVLMEPEPVDGDILGDGIAPVEQGGDQGQGGAFTLCLEWYTAPADNNMGEDFGKNDDGWRARGALVRVYYAGSEVYDGYLNSAGCALINMNAGNGGLAHIEFDGRSVLATGNGNNILRRVWAWTPPDTPTAWTTAIDINGVQSGATYRPELYGNDAFSIISYAAQERFNGGVSGKTIYLVKANCNLTINDSCSSYYDGRHTIFVKSSQWQRKFLIGHEFGHKILSLAASYTNDCSVGTNGNGHSMNATEYASCAAMEGWAHYVSADIWNNHPAGSNPGGVFVYWNGTVYDVEVQYKQCYTTWSNDWMCDGYGTEKDWMRFWWDFHTNPTPGTPPSHGQLFNIVDGITWENGIFYVSETILDSLAGTTATRWDNYACWNGIAYDHCQ